MGRMHEIFSRKKHAPMSMKSSSSASALNSPRVFLPGSENLTDSENFTGPGNLLSDSLNDNKAFSSASSSNPKRVTFSADKSIELNENRFSRAVNDNQEDDDIIATGPGTTGENSRSKSVVSISEESSLIKGYITQIQDGYTALREQVEKDYPTYSPQMKRLDYIHTCIQAAFSLNNDDLDSANDYCAAAKKLKSDHWYVYSIQASIHQAMGDYSDAESARKLMRKYMQNSGLSDSPESMAIYYGLKIDAQLKRLKVTDAKKQFRKVLEAVKQKHSESITHKTQVSSDKSQDPQSSGSELITIFKEVQSSIEVRAKGDLANDANIQRFREEVQKEICRMISTELADLRTSFQGEINNIKEEVTTVRVTSEENLKKIASISTELNKLQNEVKSIQDHIAYLAKSNELYSRKIEAMLTSYDEEQEESNKVRIINDDDALREYFKAFILTFTQAYASAQTVVAGQVSLDTDGIKKSGITTALSFIPFCGDALSTIAEKGITMWEERSLRDNAAAVTRIASSYDELYEIVNAVAVNIVLHHQKQKELHEPEPEAAHQNEGLIKKLISKISSLKSKVEKAVSGGEIFKTRFAEKGYEDASKAINELVNYISKEKDATFYKQSVITNKIKYAIIPEDEWPVAAVVDVSAVDVHITTGGLDYSETVISGAVISGEAVYSNIHESEI